MGRFDRLDRIARALDPYRGVHPRPRHLRWLPMLSLALAALGIGLQAAGRDGFGAVMAAFVLSMLFVLFGPLRNPSQDEPLDERETLLRTRASLAGAGTVAVIAMLAALLFSLSDYLRIWAPATPQDWRSVCFALVAMVNSVPPLYASWTTRPLPDED